MPNRVRYRRLLAAQTGVMATGHRSAGFAGAQVLSNAGNGVFRGPAGTNAFTAFWFKLDTLLAATYYSLFDIGIVANEVMGMRIDGPTGHLVSFKYDNSAGAGGPGVFGTVDSGFTPLAGQWYYAECNWGGVVTSNIYNGSGASVGGASGTPAGDGSYKQILTPALYVGQRSDGTFGITGEMDSFAHWRSGNPAGGTTLAAYLPDSGKARDYSDYAGSSQFSEVGAGQAATTGASLSVWYNFDQVTGASTWLDSSVNAVQLTATGMVTSQRGAGF